MRSAVGIACFACDGTGTRVDESGHEGDCEVCLGVGEIAWEDYYAGLRGADWEIVVALQNEPLKKR